ncbi:hypothetical protein [Paenibacillus alkalitolerans]|uniref:hypothetical protein n=1 Tax=Paenibacillus alkalitolerans TaxID=2799335 RepID=UPI0018F71DDE|nr:hypothetical protein [Paenibacillus alkalitolerans]
MWESKEKEAQTQEPIVLNPNEMETYRELRKQLNRARSTREAKAIYNRIMELVNHRQSS